MSYSWGLCFLYGKGWELACFLDVMRNLFGLWIKCRARRILMFAQTELYSEKKKFSLLVGSRGQMGCWELNLVLLYRRQISFPLNYLFSSIWVSISRSHTRSLIHMYAISCVYSVTKKLSPGGDYLCVGDLWSWPST